MKVTLIYPPNQSHSGTMCKPDGSLGLAYIASALRDAGIEVKIFDACVGNDKDDLDQIFCGNDKMQNGLILTGVHPARVLEETKDADVVGITSNFTDQEAMALATVNLMQIHYPDKLIVVGGVNARARYKKFLNRGANIVCLGEAEQTIVDIIRLHPYCTLNIHGITYINNIGEIQINPVKEVTQNLDELPIPAWDLLPLKRYWKLGRPHGGTVVKGAKFASMMTSRGCVFSCDYCHISCEGKDSNSGHIGKFRVKSLARVDKELKRLTELGVKQVFIEDDSFLVDKKRAAYIFDMISNYDLQPCLVNGINVKHLFHNGKPDVAAINDMVVGNVKDITIGFESGNQRIIDKYANKKWDINKLDINSLLKEFTKTTIRTVGNYMIGYPDETLEEIQNTINMARYHKECGLDQANFFCVIPLPGTKLFDDACEEGYIHAWDMNYDDMTWMKGNFQYVNIDAKQLEEIRTKAWEELNSDSFKDGRKEMRV